MTLREWLESQGINYWAYSEQEMTQLLKELLKDDEESELPTNEILDIVTDIETNIEYILARFADLNKLLKKE